MGKYRYITEYDQDGNAKIYVPQTLWEERKEQDKPVYLSDFMDELPHNCLFLKAVTGAGATTLAFRDPHNSIIALPTQNTVKSKYVIRDPDTNEIVGYNSDILCVYSGHFDKEKDLYDYLQNRANAEAPVKIVCTYDQVERITLRLLGKKIDKETGEYVDNESASMWVDISEFRLFIDEVHQVLEDYVNEKRNMNIRGMLRVINLYSDVCCITATPLRPEHTLNEIKKLPIYRVIYPSMPKRKIVKRWCPRMVNSVENLVIDYLEGREVGNAHIFVNSVKFIGDVIKGVKKKLPGFNVGDFTGLIRVICGDNETNETTIKNAVTSLIGKADFVSFIEYASKGGNVALEMEQAITQQIQENVKTLNGIEKFVNPINSNPKKINFYTKSSWLGADVFDAEAQIYIVTDGAKKHTMIDVSTSLIQILGRIRNSRNNRAYLFLNQNRYLVENDDFATQYAIDQAEREKNAEDWFSLFDKNPTMAKAVDTEYRKSQCYIMFNKVTGKYEKDDYLRIYDEISFFTLQGDYRSSANMSAKLAEVGFDVEEEANTDTVEEIKNVARNPDAKLSFKEYYIPYANLRDGIETLTLFPELSNPYQYKAIYESLEPYVKGAYEYLGTPKVEALKYRRKDVVTLVDKEEQKAKEKQIRQNLRLRIKVGNVYTNPEIDNILTVVESTLNLQKSLKIADYYEVLNTTKRDENGKTVGAKKIVGYTSKKGG